MAGIKDVAKAAGVSPSTVSNVLNGRSNVGAKTKERVLKNCVEMDRIKIRSFFYVRC